MQRLVVKNIKKSYGGIDIIKDVSLSVSPHEFVSLVGPSGCGKSTLLNIISGIETPDSGSVLINGKDSIGKTGRVSYMHQKDLLLPWKTVLDNVSLSLVLKGESWGEARKKALTYLDTFGLKGFEKAYPSQLSGGMRQRAALLRTYLFTKDIMLLDEPFANLDAITRRKMHLWLIKFFDKYKPSVLFITHDIDEAVLLSDKIYVLSERPAVIKGEFKVSLDRPRSTQMFAADTYIKLKEDILNLL